MVFSRCGLLIIPMRFMIVFPPLIIIFALQMPIPLIFPQKNTRIEQHDLKIKIDEIIILAYHLCKRKFLTFYSRYAKYSNVKSWSHLQTDCTQFIHAIHWPNDHIYVRFGNAVFRQNIGIPMGTNCTPLLANLYLFSYE